eukprot:3289415-Rhodomonas_salina.1
MHGGYGVEETKPARVPCVRAVLPATHPSLLSPRPPPLQTLLLSASSSPPTDPAVLAGAATQAAARAPS